MLLKCTCHFTACDLLQGFMWLWMDVCSRSKVLAAMENAIVSKRMCASVLKMMQLWRKLPKDNVLKILESSSRISRNLDMAQGFGELQELSKSLGLSATELELCFMRDEAVKEGFEQEQMDDERHKMKHGQEKVADLTPSHVVSDQSYCITATAKTCFEDFQNIFHNSSSPSGRALRSAARSIFLSAASAPTSFKGGEQGGHAPEQSGGCSVFSTSEASIIDSSARFISQHSSPVEEGSHPFEVPCSAISSADQVLQDKEQSRSKTLISEFTCVRLALTNTHTNAHKHSQY